MFKSEGWVRELLPSVIHLFFSCTMCALFFLMNNGLKLYPYFNLRQHWMQVEILYIYHCGLRHPFLYLVICLSQMYFISELNTIWEIILGISPFLCFPHGNHQSFSISHTQGILGSQNQLGAAVLWLQNWFS